MSVSTKSPLNQVGGQLYSGGPRTGEWQQVRGGSLCATVLSGSLVVNAFSGTAPGSVASGGHVLFFSGAGRLNNATVISQAAASGPAPVFYDAGAIAPSGISTSGQRALGVIPNIFQPYQLPGSISGGGYPPVQYMYYYDTPFTSGLCASVPSGVGGFTVSWTPEVVPSLPNDAG
jgi:hypothetical protein